LFAAVVAFTGLTSTSFATTAADICGPADPCVVPARAR
jgi:hypothetical protein